MQLADRAQFDSQLGTLCAGFNVPVTDLRSEAYWRGLAKMQLGQFARVVEHALGPDGPERIPTAPQCWTIARQLRAQRPRATEPAATQPTVTPLVAFGNRCLLRYLREARGVDDSTLARLVAEKGRIAANFAMIASEETVTAEEVRAAMFAAFAQATAWTG